MRTQSSQEAEKIIENTYKKIEKEIIIIKKRKQVMQFAGN